MACGDEGILPEKVKYHTGGVNMLCPFLRLKVPKVRSTIQRALQLEF